MNYFKKVFRNEELTREKTRLYGMYKGYYICAACEKETGQFVVRVTYSGTMDGTKERIISALNRIVNEQKKPPVVQVEEHFVEIRTGNMPLVKVSQWTEWAVDSIIKILVTENCTSGCEACGGQMEVSYYDINDGMHMLCPACANEIQGKFEGNKQAVRSQKSNFFAGIVGALIGSLIGVVLWVIIYQLGYIAGIAGAVTVVCAMAGYEKLGKSLDVKGIVVSFLISIIMIFVANQLSWSLVITREFARAGYDISFFDVNSHFFELVREADLMADFVGELVIGYFLFIVAGISSVIKAVRDARGNYKMKKL